MTEDSELSDLIRRARAVAEPVGPLHAWWDTISDAEALLAGKPPLLKRTKRELINDLAQMLARR